MANPKILVASPVCDKTKYCINQFLESIKNIDYDNYDILLVDNSDSDDFLNELKSKNINAVKDNSKGNGMEKVVNSRNKIIDYASEKGYDYVLMMDSDVIPPKNIIKELLMCSKEIISGLYYNYFVSSGKLKILPVAWMPITKEEFGQIKQIIKLPDWMKTHEDMRRHLTQEEVESKKPLKVLYPSAGCMLISKKVFEKVRYGLIKVPKEAHTSDDIFFIKEARKLGFESYCHTGIKCHHLVKEKYKKDSQGNLVHQGFKD